MSFNVPLHISNASYKYLFASGDRDKKGKGDRYAEARPELQSGDLELPKFLWEFQPVPNGPSGEVLIWNQQHGYLYASDEKDGSHVIAKVNAEAGGSKFRWKLERHGGWFTIENRNGGFLFAAGSTVRKGDHVAECGTMSMEDGQPVLKFRWFLEGWRPHLDRWIGELSPAPGALISSLTLPGTHDSATYLASVPEDIIAQCQDLSFEDQLKQGTRFLDARLKYVPFPPPGIPIPWEGPTLWFFHGPIFLRLSFGMVIDELREYLKSHPGEFVVLSVQNEEDRPYPHKAEFSRLVREECARHPESWFVANRIPTYREAKGKIVLMRRYVTDDAAPIGIQAVPWGGDPIQTLDNGAGLPKICRQDYWELKNNNQADLIAKWGYVKQQLDAAKASSQPEVTYLNFTSAAGTFAHLGNPTPTAVAETINPQTLQYLGENPEGRYGMVIVDFADAEINGKIVAANDFAP